MPTAVHTAPDVNRFTWSSQPSDATPIASNVNRLARVSTFRLGSRNRLAPIKLDKAKSTNTPWANKPTDISIELRKKGSPLGVARGFSLPCRLNARD